MDDETIEQRLRAVERAISEDEVPDHVAERAALAGRVDGAEADIADVEERLAEVEAAVQALRGYVGDVRNVNRDVERRADSALAKVEQLEADAARRDRASAAERNASAGDAGRGERSTDRRERPDEGRRESPPRADARSTGEFAPEHPIPEPPTEDRSLRERIAAWL